MPQGSILGPLLFLLYTNDLANTTNYLNIILFADDTTLFASHKNSNRNDNIFLFQEKYYITFSHFKLIHIYNIILMTYLFIFVAICNQEIYSKKWFQEMISMVTRARNIIYTHFIIFSSLAVGYQAFFSLGTFTAQHHNISRYIHLCHGFQLCIRCSTAPDDLGRSVSACTNRAKWRCGGNFQK